MRRLCIRWVLVLLFAQFLFAVVSALSTNRLFVPRAPSLVSEGLHCLYRKLCAKLFSVAAEGSTALHSVCRAPLCLQLRQLSSLEDNNLSTVIVKISTKNLKTHRKFHLLGSHWECSNLLFGPLYKAMQVPPLVDYTCGLLKFAKWYSTNWFHGYASKIVFFICGISAAMEFITPGKATAFKISVADFHLNMGWNV